MKLSFLTEHIVNIHDKRDMTRYKDEVWALLHTAYSKTPQSQYSPLCPIYVLKNNIF